MLWDLGINFSGPPFSRLRTSWCENRLSSASSLRPAHLQPREPLAFSLCLRSCVPSVRQDCRSLPVTTPNSCARFTARSGVASRGRLPRRPPSSRVGGSPGPRAIPEHRLSLRLRSRKSAVMPRFLDTASAHADIPGVRTQVPPPLTLRCFLSQILEAYDNSWSAESTPTVSFVTSLRWPHGLSPQKA